MSLWDDEKVLGMGGRVSPVPWRRPKATMAKAAVALDTSVSSVHSVAWGLHPGHREPLGCPVAV